MTPKKPSLSIVIPAYNEAHIIAATIREIESFVQSRFKNVEIIVVNDGSKDSTAQIVAELQHTVAGPITVAIINHKQRKGKGYAVRSGVFHAQNDYILMTDADLSTPIADLKVLMQRLDSGADIAIGSRWIRGSHVIVKQPLFRRILSRIFNILVRTLVIDGFRDTQCGFKLFRAEAAREIFSKCRIDGFAFDVEVLFIARQEGYNVVEAPVTWINKSIHSKVSLRSDYTAMLFDLFRIKFMHGSH